MSDQRLWSLKVLAVVILCCAGLAFLIVVLLGAGTLLEDSLLNEPMALVDQALQWTASAASSDRFWSVLGTTGTLAGVAVAVYAVRKQRLDEAVRDLNPSQPLPEPLAGLKPGDSGPIQAPGEQETPVNVVKRALAATDPDEAIKLFQHAAQMTPIYLPAWSNLAAALYNAKRYPEALPVAKKLSELSPSYAPYLNILAKTLRALRRRKEALKLAIEASELPSASGNVWHTLGLLFGDVHHDLSAANALAKAIELAPGNADARRDYADMLVRIERFEDALRAYNEYLATNRGQHDFRVMVRKASVLMHLQRYDDALAAVAAAKKENPTFGHADKIRAAILRAQGKKAEARAALHDGKVLERARTSVASVKVR